ncbi:hypothetical protein ABH927_006849 [Planotetraspora sp. GP83]
MSEASAILPLIVSRLIIHVLAGELPSDEARDIVQVTGLAHMTVHPLGREITDTYLSLVDGALRSNRQYLWIKIF